MQHVTDFDIRQTLLQDQFLHSLLLQQAQTLTGCPGWPTTKSATYELLVKQIETDLTANGGKVGYV